MNKKLLLKSACIAFVISVIFSVIPFQAQCKAISEDVFRLHILANSDSDEDQNLKLKVRDRILEYTEELFRKAESKEEAERLVLDNLQSIADEGQKTVHQNGYNYEVKAEITNMYFTTRHYDKYTLPSGMYDALRITIGSGEGHNWWCVMFPSICITAAQDRDSKAREVLDDNEYSLVTNECEYKFFVVEMFEKMCSLF